MRGHILELGSAGTWKLQRKNGQTPQMQHHYQSQNPRVVDRGRPALCCLHLLKHTIAFPTHRLYVYVREVSMYCCSLRTKETGSKIAIPICNRERHYGERCSNQSVTLGDFFQRPVVGGLRSTRHQSFAHRHKNHRLSTRGCVEHS